MKTFVPCCLAALLLLGAHPTLFAQKVPVKKPPVRPPAAAKNAVEDAMGKKYAEPQRQKGKEELEKITYENDTRYKDPNNKVQATITFEDKTFTKKGEIKKTTISKVIFGKTGECMVNEEGDKNETWFIYNYADKANYVCNIKDKSAIKMPLINAKKMAEKMAKKEAEREESDKDMAGWKATDTYETINGFKARKYIYTYEKNPKYSVLEAWLSKEVSLNLSGNYMMGARLDSYKFPAGSNTAKDMVEGFIVRQILYNKKEEPVSQRDLKSLTKTADEKYFDMTGFKVIDVLSTL